LQALQVETGNEDLPDAYRYVPNDPVDEDVNVFGAFDEHSGEWLYQVLFGMVFGKSSGVVVFHRPQRFMQSLSRRWLVILRSMYFDDATLQDLHTAKGQGQLLLCELFSLVGIPFAEEKQVDMGNSADTLGIEHYLKDCLWSGEITVCPRERLRQKIDDFIHNLLVSRQCTPADASKLFGTQGFAMTGYFGRVARAGQHALLQRQCWESEPWWLSYALERAFVFSQQLSMTDITRTLKINPADTPSIAIASDGRQDQAGPPSVAVLLVDPFTSLMLAWVAVLPVALCDRWGQFTDHYITLIEQSAVVIGLIETSPYIRGRDVVWFEDNSAALSSFLKV